MTKQHQIVLRRSLEDRRRALLHAHHSSSKRFAEVAGNTTAEMAAVGCCFPFAVVDFMVLTMYKVPAGLCRNALRKKSRRRISNKMQGAHGGDDLEFSMHPAVAAAAERFMTAEADEDMIALEKEMWEKFYETGFWRSPSRRFD